MLGTEFGQVVRDLRDQRIITKRCLSSEIEKIEIDKSPWLVYGSSHRDYEYTLGLPQGILDQVVENKRKTGRPCVGFDVMGDGEALRTLGIGGTALTLKDFRSDLQKENDTKNGIKVVEGNIIDRRTWRKIKEAGSKFSLILMRPEGGVNAYEHLNVGIQWYIIQKLWENLTINGEIFAQVPYMSMNLLTRYAWLVKGSEGIVIQDVPQALIPSIKNGRTLHIIKREGASPKLPRIHDW